MFNIVVGDYSLIESGTAITPKGADLHFYVRDLEFVFSFIDETQEKPRVNFKSNTGKKLEVELVNFNDVLGIGNINPIRMGTLDGKELYIMFRVSVLKEGGKTMMYSWYVKDIVESNGDNNA